MTTITQGQKLYFAAVGLLALWVGIWGYFFPTHVDQVIPWLVPPLHARFLGAMYLSGAAFMIGAIASYRYAEVRTTVFGIAVWTGMLFVVSLFYLNEFDYSRAQVWIWFGAYVVYPLIALWVFCQHRNRSEKIKGIEVPGWARGYLLIQGIVLTTLAVLLLLGLMVAAWPWKISGLLAQLYSAPFLSYGLMSLMLYRQQTWLELRTALFGIFVFSFCVLLASFAHRSLFSVSSLSSVLWFAGFSLATVMLGLLVAKSVQGASV
jgi:hypothetical protein